MDAYEITVVDDEVSQNIFFWYRNVINIGYGSEAPFSCCKTGKGWLDVKIIFSLTRCYRLRIYFGNLRKATSGKVQNIIVGKKQLIKISI